MRLLVSTKILSEKQRNAFESSDFQLLEHDFICIIHNPITQEVTGDLLLFTSQNAVKSVLNSEGLASVKKRPAICVGEKTASLLCQHGWEVLFFKPYAADLANEIRQKVAGQKITFFCGNLRRDTLPEFFKHYQMAFEEIQVYRTVYAPKKIQGKPYGVLFFSPSEVKSYVLENQITTEWLFCIGTTTAQEAQKHSQNLVLADRPTVESLVEKCLKH